MPLATLQILEGLERGRVYENLRPPVTIGREDDNSIRLNDERISRFHAKIQEEGDQFILTDLESTNGTRVNGHPVQMRVLQVGDQINLGRCILVFGSREQIQEKLAKSLAEQQAADGEDPSKNRVAAPTDVFDADAVHGDDSDFEADVLPNEERSLFPDGPPSLPDGITPLQKARVSDLLAWMHDSLADVIHVAEESQSDERVYLVDDVAWQRLLALEFHLADYMRRLGEPDA